MSAESVPVIAIDGPSASGKGTVAQLVAAKLGYHYLDSGALYRIVGVAATQQNIALNDANHLGMLASRMDIGFQGDEIMLDGKNITSLVRSERGGQCASEVAVHPPVRAALLNLQRDMRKMPGLVGDGRDIGSVIFPDAKLKIFLTASAEVRAQRRFLQYQQKGITADYQQILADLQARDLRDSARSAAPLLQTPDALLLDTSERTIEQAVDFVLNAYKNKY